MIAPRESTRQNSGPEGPAAPATGSRELIRRLIDGEPVERCGLWLGNPHPDTWPILHRYFGTSTEEQLRHKCGDEVRWICPQLYPDAYQDPENRGLFDVGLAGKSKTAMGVGSETRIRFVDAVEADGTLLAGWYERMKYSKQSGSAPGTLEHP